MKKIGILFLMALLIGGGDCSNEHQITGFGQRRTEGEIFVGLLVADRLDHPIEYQLVVPNGRQ